ncbi:MAG: hypothetical protein IJE77_05800, partial [Thermoguttaceae bacterium]|nr:hypothetical protein [Thermoguttaceae bacterium]
MSQYMQVDDSTDSDGGWTIFDSVDAARSSVAQPRLDLSVLKEIKNFLTADETPADDSFFGDETLVDSNEVRVAYPFYDGAPVDVNGVERPDDAPETAESLLASAPFASPISEDAQDAPILNALPSPFPSETSETSESSETC